MFVEEKAAGETPVKVGTLKLSEAIRKGKPLVKEDKRSFQLCALGCAWAGVKGRPMSNAEYQACMGSGWIGKQLGFDPILCFKVSEMHTYGKPALRIADELEAQGY